MKSDFDSLLALDFDSIIAAHGLHLKSGTKKALTTEVVSLFR